MEDKEQEKEEIWTLVQIEQQMIESLEQCDTIPSANLCIKSYTNYLIQTALLLEQERPLADDELEILKESTTWEDVYFGGHRK